MNKFNVWNKWGKLKTVMLGSHYTRDFFKDIKNARIRNALQRIADETQEDLDYYESVLKDFGCTVLRPKLDSNDSIMNYINLDGKLRHDGRQGVPRSPLQPRDNQLVIGNTLYYVDNFGHPSIEAELSKYSNNVSHDLKKINLIKNHPALSKNIFETYKGNDWLEYEDYLLPDYFDKVTPEIFSEFKENPLSLYSAPSLTLVGRDLYFDSDYVTGTVLENQKNILNEIFNLLEKKFRINTLSHGGHSDGCFHTLKPGAILSLDEIQTYENTFPNWDVCYLEEQSWSKVKEFWDVKSVVGRKWWVPGEEENDEFTYFVEDWLNNWVGYVEESVFDVNVLVLDEHHVCINNMNPIVIEFLKKHNMEPIHVPFRHRYFWDGGLHCITLDLVREGEQEDYFPERGDVGVIDYGFD